jgi:hypothetical protein
MRLMYAQDGQSLRLNDYGLTPSDRDSTRTLTETQCGTIREVLAYEKENGTWATSLRFSNSLSKIGISPDIELGDVFIDAPIPTVYGVVDLDWFTDMLAFSIGTGGSIDIGPVSLPLLTDIEYLIGKSVWNEARKSEGLPYADPYEDPKERNSLRLLREGIKTYSVLFPDLFMDENCPQMCFVKP